MARRKLAVSDFDQTIAELVRDTDHKIVAVWAADCAERVLPCFEEKYPDDTRPRTAIEACREWARTGVFRMADVRRTSLDAHAAARDVNDDPAARSAARAAGQAMATAHVPTHAIAAALYAATAVRDAADPADAEQATTRERAWQYHHLLELKENHFPHRGSPVDTRRKKFDTIDDYIGIFPPDIQEILQNLRRTIREIVPEAEEAIRYGIPTFRFRGNLVHFAAYRDHVGFYPGPSAIDAFREELSPYDLSKGTIRFPIDKPVPLDLVRRIVQYRVKEEQETKKPKR
jgi:uncharacterized protein YdhG (YjbR/CyaY superfamily)